MEQDFGSECSSGCESGWTFYLGHSMYHCDSFQTYKNSDEDDDDDNMSMVSDASSGPPHVQQQEQEQEQACNNNNNGVFSGWKGEKVVVNKKGREIQDLPCCFDDTATTSSFFNFSHVANNPEYSLGESSNVIANYSKEQFQSESRFQDQFGGFKSSVSGTRLQQNQLRSPCSRS